MPVCVFSSLEEAQFTYHKQFVISFFIELVKLYKHHQNLVLEYIHHPQKSLVPVSGHFPSTLHPRHREQVVFLILDLYFLDVP